MSHTTRPPYVKKKWGRGTGAPLIGKKGSLYTLAESKRQSCFRVGGSNKACRTRGSVEALTIDQAKAREIQYATQWEVKKFFVFATSYQCHYIYSKAKNTKKSKRVKMWKLQDPDEFLNKTQPHVDFSWF